MGVTKLANGITAADLKRPRKLLPLEQARAKRTPIKWRAEDVPLPTFTGVRVLPDVSLATLREYID